MGWLALLVTGVVAGVFTWLGDSALWAGIGGLVGASLGIALERVTKGGRSDSD